MHTLQSVTKSVTASLIGIAIGQGKISGVNAPLLSFFGDYDVANVDPRLKKATLADLLTMRTGIEWHENDRPLDDTNTTLQLEKSKDWIRFTLSQPSDAEPGTKWVYSVSVDIQGYLVEKLSGKTFPEFLRTRIFDPLGMVDTGFSVPAEKISRVATIYSWDRAKSALAPEPLDPNISKLPGLPSGGGGLYGTAADYFRFAQMLLNGGELNGTRILKKATVDMMRTNVLSDAVLNGNNGIGQARFSPAQGFGYDFAVVLDPDAAKRQVGKGSYWWWGIAGTWFWIDPANDVVFVGIIQRRSGPPGAASHEDISRRVIAEALPKSH